MRYCCGISPSASNCLDHSAGASRSRSMLMPRGRRPSTAARTSFSDCAHHHAVLSNRVISSRVQIALFVPGFPLSALAPFSLCGQSVSLVAILAALSPHPKIPFLADRPWRSKPATFATLEPDLGGIDPGGGGGVRYCCGLSPSASNCRLHSAGASRSRSMLMPRGRRPSTAARTSLGARNASEMVILT